MEKSFFFVDSTQVDRTTKKSMRSHVMKGKNVGKTLHRASKLDLVKRSLSSRKPLQRNLSALSKEEIDAHRRNSHFFPIDRNFGNLLLTISFPINLTKYSLEVINQFYFYIKRIYYIQIPSLNEETQSRWLQVLLMDETACHCAIALMATCNEFFRGDFSSLGTLYHISKTITLVNERLESDKALSDSTLAIVVMLIIQEQIRDERREAEIHYGGLQKMIELRGGIHQLENNLPLLLKICKLDITYALQYGRPLLYFRDHMLKVYTTLTLRGFVFDQKSAASTIQHDGLDPSINEILVDARMVSFLLNTGSAHAVLDSETLYEIIISICVRLITFHPLHSLEQQSDVDAAYHVGLTLFVMSLFLQYDHRRVVKYELVSQSLKYVLDRDLGKTYNDLALWLMFMGGIWTSGDPDGFWIISRARRLIEKLEINSWLEVNSRVANFPWIKTLHDGPGNAVWNSIYQSHQLP